MATTNTVGPIQLPVDVVTAPASAKKSTRVNGLIAVRTTNRA